MKAFCTLSAILVLCLSSVATADDHSVPLVITGSLKVRAHFELREGHDAIVGQVVDESGHPVVATLEPVDTNGSTALGWQSCSSARSTNTLGSPNLSDAGGAFCLVRLGSSAELPRYLSALAPHLEGTRIDLKTGTLGQSVPRIVRAPEAYSLIDVASFVVEAVVDGQAATSGSLELAVRCDGDLHRLQTQPVVPFQLARFEMAARDLPGPGPCTLLAQLKNGDPQPRVLGTDERHVIFQAPVTLRIEDVLLSNDRAHLQVEAFAQVGARRHLVNGLIEASTKGAFLASAPLTDGRAELELARSPDDIEVVLRFRSTTDGLQADEPANVFIPKAGAHLPQLAAKVAAMAGFLAWLVYAWLGRTKTAAPPGPEISGRPELQVRRATPGPISGSVVDAHTGAGIAQALITLLVVKPTGRSPLETVKSNEHGIFQLESRSDISKLLKLHVESEGYDHFEAALGGSNVRVQLIALRRAALVQFIRWAERRSGWFRGQIPTPLGAVDAARRRKDFRAADWAARTSTVVYSPETVTQRTVRELSSSSDIDV